MSQCLFSQDTCTKYACLQQEPKSESHAIVSIHKHILDQFRSDLVSAIKMTEIL